MGVLSPIALPTPSFLSAGVSDGYHRGTVRTHFVSDDDLGAGFEEVDRGAISLSQG